MHNRGAVIITNKSGIHIKSISVVHKYSDVYKNQLDWNQVEPWTSTTEQFVDYNVGFLTTGMDWWLVTFVDDHGITYISDPDNFRDVVDALEKDFDRISNAAAELSGNAFKPAVLVASAIAGLFINSESTVGFKEHMLTFGDDDTQPTEIIIYDNGNMTFHSRSGDSKTVYNRYRAPQS